MKYGDITLGQVEAIVNKLGGMDGVRRLLKGELVVVEKTNVRFKVFKTIKLGTIRFEGFKFEELPDAFRRILKKNKFFTNDHVDAILNKPAFVYSVATEETEVQLTVVSGKELNFIDYVTREMVYKRAQEVGLRLCPAEVGPQLRLQYKNQPEGERLIIGMEPIWDPNEMVFCIRRSGCECELALLESGRNDIYKPQDCWVFLIPS